MLKREVPARYAKLVTEVESGSLAAALKLMCLSCTAWQPNEVRLCHLARSPFHHRRPYQPTRRQGGAL